MPRSSRAGVVAIVVVAALSTLSGAENWPRFRGPTAGALPDNPKLPVQWDRKTNVAWKVDVPGFAWASPIVWGDYVFVTSVTSDEPPPPGTNVGGLTLMNLKPLTTPYTWTLYAFDFQTGRVRWERELRRGFPPYNKQGHNSYASETPVTDGKYVYVYHSNAGLFAVDFNGKVVWSRELTPPAPQREIATRSFGGLRFQRPATLAHDYIIGNGHGASPTLYKDRIFVSVDHEPRQWFFGAFSTRDGRQIWAVNETKTDENYGDATPFVWDNGRRTEIVFVGNNSVRSYTPDGTLLWQLNGLSLQTVPTPFAAGGLLYAQSGHTSTSFRPVYAIRPGASGDISLKDEETRNAYVAWVQRSAASFLPSALVYGDYYYTLHSQGFLTCHDAKTGREVYGRQRISASAGNFTTSPWAYNGKIFLASEDGDTYIVQAGPEYKLLGKNSLEELTLATPAIVRGSLIFRTVSSLWRIANRDSR